MRVLCLTAYLQLQDSVAGGIFSRQAALFEAISTFASDIRVIYYTHHDRNAAGGPYTDADLEEIAKRRWGPAISLEVCRRDPPARRSFPASLAGLWSIFGQPGYSSMAGEAQSEAFEKAVREFRPDLVFVHRLSAMPPVLRAKSALPPICFDLDDIEHVALARDVFSRPIRLGGLHRALQLPALIAAEKRALRLSTKTFVCSEHDVELLKKFADSDRLTSIPNSIRLPEHWGRARGNSLLMVGGYGFPPNRLGIERYVREVFPVVRAGLPDCRLLVAGPGAEHLSFADEVPDGVEVLGFVDDLAQLYGSAAAVICPIYTGAGTRVKLVEAAAFGMPIVSTAIGAQGLEFSNGREILIAGNSAEFARHCLKVLTDTTFADELGSNARKLVARRYDRNLIVNRLVQVLNDAVIN